MTLSREQLAEMLECERKLTRALEDVRRIITAALVNMPPEELARDTTPPQNMGSKVL